MQYAQCCLFCQPSLCSGRSAAELGVVPPECALGGTAFLFAGDALRSPVAEFEALGSRAASLGLRLVFARSAFIFALRSAGESPLHLDLAERACISRIYWEIEGFKTLPFRNWDIPPKNVFARRECRGRRRPFCRGELSHHTRSDSQGQTHIASCDLRESSRRALAALCDRRAIRVLQFSFLFCSGLRTLRPRPEDSIA